MGIAKNEPGQPAAKDGYVDCDQHALVRISYVAAFHSRGCPLCNMSELQTEDINSRFVDEIEKALARAKDRIAIRHAEADRSLEMRHGKG